MDRRAGGQREIARRALRLFAVLLFGLLFAAGCGILPVSRTASPPPEGSLLVSFIDVGQGDATLIQSGGKNYLIDGGRPEAGPEVVDFLRGRGIDELDGMVATHPDSDHIGGLPDVLDAFPVEKFYLSGELRGSTLEYSLLEGVREEGAEVTRVHTGMRMGWGSQRLEASVLSPPEAGFFESDNGNSVALLLTFGEARVLLPGDAESETEEYMANSQYATPLTVLKVGHHGSSTSTTPLFLSRFRPRVAVISAGEDNDYGHPTGQTLRRLETAGARTFRTDTQGDVIVTIGQDKVEVAVTEPQ